MSYKLVSANTDRLPAWDFDAHKELEFSFIGTRPGSGKGSDYTFHEVEEVTTKEKYSLLGNTVLNGYFGSMVPGERGKLVYKGTVKGKGGRAYKNFETYTWADDAS